MFSFSICLNFDKKNFMQKNSTPSLIVFIKNPILGKVKTRIAATTGEIKALEIYKQLLEYTQKTSLAFSGDRLLFYDGSVQNDNFSEADFLKMSQKGKDLGQKMYNALSYALGYCEKVVLIGSDCPTLTNKIIDESFEILNTNDVVIGPSKDGGYYLIGMKNAIWDIFNDIDWSTNKVLNQTISKLKKANKTYKLLEELSDIDTEKDWIEFNKKYKPDNK